MRQAQLADGTILEFPDETPDSVMDATVKRHLGAPAVSAAPTAEILRDRPESTWATTPQRPAEVGEIRATPPPPTFLEGMGQGAVNIAKRWGPEILPIAGLITGGALGGTAGAAGGPLAPATVPGGAAIGAGVGYATGRQANTAIESLFNYLTGNPQSAEGSAGIVETAGRIGKEALTGAAIEAGGQVLGAAGGKLSEILRDAGVPGFGGYAADPAVAAATRVGIELPAGAATQSRALSAIEATPGRFPFGAKPSREFYDQTALSAQRAAERLAQSAGPPATLEVAGRGIQQDVAGLAQSQEQAARDLIDQYIGQFGVGREFGPGALGAPNRTSLGAEVQSALDAAQIEARGKIAPLYQGVRDEVSAAGSAVPMTATKEVADRILELEQRMTSLGRSGVSRPAASATDIASGAVPAEVAQLPATMQESVIRQLGLDQGRAIEPDIAMELSKRLRAAASNAPDDVTRRALNELRTAVEQDVNAWANVSGTNVGPLRQQAAQAYREQIVPYFSEKAPLRRIMDAEPEVAGQALLSGRDPQLLKDALQFLPAETQNRIRAEILGGLPRDPAGFEKALSAMGDDTLAVLLGPEYGTKLADLRSQLRSGFGPQTIDPQLAGIAGKEGSVETLVNSLTKGKYKSVEDFDATWQAISPETQNQVRSASLHRLIEEAVDPGTRVFSVERFMSRQGEIQPIIWQRMLGQDQKAAMDDIVTALSRFNDYTRGAANPSQTGRTILGTHQLLGMAGVIWSTITGHQDPGAAALEMAAITSPQWGGKMLFSKRAQNFLKQPGGQGSSAWAPLSRFLGIELTPSER